MIPTFPRAGTSSSRGRGTTFVREAGDPGATTLLLLHGWTANADVSWRAVYPALAARFHVVALDHRGHGRGIRVVPPVRQLELAASIPGATAHAVHGDHAVCLAQAEELVPRLLEAIDAVVARAERPLRAA